MNFLALAKSLRQEAGVPGNGPESVIDQTGQLKKLVDWVARSWSDIQGMHDNWTFLRKDFSFPVTAGTSQVTPATASLSDFKIWHTDTFRIYQTTIGVLDEQFLTEWNYKTFRDTYRYGLQVASRPMNFAINPADSAVMFGPVTDVDMTCIGQYQSMGVTLAADLDTPVIDENLHMVIVWHALKKYARFEAATEALIQANAEYATLIAQMERKYLPEVCFGDPLA